MENKFKIENNSLEEKVLEQIEKDELNDQGEKKCIVCNKAFDYDYDLFGRSCLENMYELLNIPMPSWSFKNKEMFLCTKVAHKRNKYFLSKEKKFFITKRVITLAFLDEINYYTLDNIKKDINNDIDNVKIFSREIKEIFPFKLNTVYLASHMVDKFNEIMKERDAINRKKTTEDYELMANFLKKI